MDYRSLRARGLFPVPVDLDHETIETEEPSAPNDHRSTRSSVPSDTSVRIAANADDALETATVPPRDDVLRDDVVRDDRSWAQECQPAHPARNARRAAAALTMLAAGSLVLGSSVGTMIYRRGQSPVDQSRLVHSAMSSSIAVKADRELHARLLHADVPSAEDLSPDARDEPTISTPKEAEAATPTAPDPSEHAPPPPESGPASDRTAAPTRAAAPPEVPPTSSPTSSPEFSTAVSVSEPTPAPEAPSLPKAPEQAQAAPTRPPIMSKGMRLASTGPVQEHVTARALIVAGETAFRSGDLKGARISYRKAVELGSPEAALALGTTYDRKRLRSSPYASAGDTDIAKHWYGVAYELARQQAQAR